MKAFDLHRMAFDKVPFDFLGEVALRSLYTFVLVFLFLKMTGRRGVRQMSLFEVLIILTLGSAAGDVAFYDDVPMVPVLIVFITLALLYRLVMWLMAHSEKLEDLLEGKPVVIIEDGELAWSKLNNSNMTEFEFFMELRLKRRTKNAKAFHDKCENFSFRASNETAVLITAFYSLHGDHLGYG